MKNFYNCKAGLFFIMIAIGSAQSVEQGSNILQSKLDTGAGGFINVGTDGLEIDGFFEIQTRNGLFGEAWISQLDMDAETNTALNTSAGIMTEISPGLILGGGYSNYTEINNDMLHEFFLGANLNFFTGVVFLGIGGELSPNFLGIADLNSFSPSIPIDLSLMGIYSENFDESGYDLFFRASRNFDTGLSLGYTFSRERFEDKESSTITKQGHTKTFIVPVPAEGYFNAIYIGFTF
jgi:hypothetical protein